MRRFSWKRATGFSTMKRRFNKATGITAGRKAKFAVEHPADALLYAAEKSAKRSMKANRKRRAGCPCSVFMLAGILGTFVLIGQIL